MQKEVPVADTTKMAPTVETAAKIESADEKTDKLNVEFGDNEAFAAELKTRSEEIKALIAEKVREDAKQRSALTLDEEIVALDIDLRYGRIDYLALLVEMTTDDRFSDIKTITTATGILFVYSDRDIADDDAVAKSVVEEAKIMLASVIRGDSHEKVRLTPVADIHTMAPDTEPKIIDIILKGMQSEERYSDIKTVIAGNGDAYFHSTKYLVESYAATLLLAMAADHCATIALTVRDDSRIYPTTTNAANFRQQVYGVPAEKVEAIIDELLRNPEYSDIKRMVHPETGAVHLYSDRYLDEETAWAKMDWIEVGRANNP